MTAIAQPILGEAEIERVSDVIQSGTIADGPEVRDFEHEFAAYCDAAHGVATSNGTTALHAALSGLGIGSGDRVLTTPFSFIATANAIRHVGAEPVFADVDPTTYNLDPDSARAVAADAEIDAIVVVHLYGLPTEMDAFVDLADELEVALVEDAAQAHGATYDGRPVGTFGDAACFSFYPTKNMTTGEGGIVVTDRADVAERVRQFINHGRTGTYEHATVGHNFRMTSLAAAIGRVQLERLPGFVERRRENATRLSAGLSDTDLVLPVEPPPAKHAFHQYTVRVRSHDRTRLADHLADHDIESGVYYPTCIHGQPAYDEIDADAPLAEQAARDVLSLPVHPSVTDAGIDRISTVITRYLT
ncbi:DegT/DnrJ/EryC1/StrS family aminotransferase [Salinadaptatus halalkaliphilus]|uniref:DegT/DnrJ/EryC1/StrS family aminotransferase n=1 Tax=Salinadaptatus halalkaliphilus TaxID=2419781 RepID=A0A4S3TLE7_9EURY|nr:DegT/DnrJ/EryC1/StrS family aminotransferase [Salinadaptatus halalkaliphilus]THE64430.1 DegT/DnrJ/EryC1/StrS family aminotransferase [Salinadaptatus halalkaliphilus]